MLRSLDSARRSRRSALGRLAIASVLALSVSFPVAGSASAVACDVASQTWRAVAEPDAALTEAFASYGNDHDGWSGGDSTYSVTLGAGRRVWAFSDTLIGPVNDDGTQPLDTEFVNSSFVVEAEGQPTRTVTGGTPAERTGLLAPTESGWYWQGASHLTDDGRSLDVVFLHFERFGPGQWDWAWSANVLGRFDSGSLRLREVVPLPSESGVNWGSWIARDGAHTLVYGVEDLGLVKYMRIARVAGDDLTQPWEYWTGDGWSSAEADSVRVMPGVANEYSVTAFGDGYLLVTHDTNELFSARIVGYVSCAPTGPFLPIGTLYTTPETGLFGSYGNPNVFTYNAHEHPDLRSADGLLVTYNVNSFEPDDLYADVTIYRPRFVRVDLQPVP
jgi:hypothetical protein